MFEFLKRKKDKSELIVDVTSTESDEERDRSSRTIATGLSATGSARVSAEQASRTFSKPSDYTGNRQLYDSGIAKKGAKLNTFANNSEVKDPYNGHTLELRKADAKLKHGDDWQNHLAESDHITPIEKIFKENKDNPWLRNDDIKDIANSGENLEVVSRKFNNAKRSRTNEDFVTDDAYLEKTGVELSEQGKQKAIERGNKSEALIKNQVKKTSVKNAVKTGHEAGKYSAKNAGITSATMSGIMNIYAVIKGEKSAEDALKDVAIDSGKATATGYVLGGGLTTVSQSLTSSSSSFLQALSKSNVPGKVITAVMATGDTIKRYSNGDISTQECIIELGDRGLSLATSGYSMAVGQALIPIPVVGAAVGALVGSAITSSYYNNLITNLKIKELEHQERQRIIAECKEITDESRAFRAELEYYLEEYFREYKGCFDESLSEIRNSFEIGDADGVIYGANQITRKLGGEVHYETVEEFKDFLSDDAVDIL